MYLCHPYCHNYALTLYSIYNKRFKRIWNNFLTHPLVLWSSSDSCTKGSYIQHVNNKCIYSNKSRMLKNDTYFYILNSYITLHTLSYINISYKRYNKLFHIIVILIISNWHFFPKLVLKERYNIDLFFQFYILQQCVLVFSFFWLFSNFQI